MKLFLPLLLSLTASAAVAQSDAPSFQDRVFETAATTGEARIPVLCGGLYQSFTRVFADDAQSVEAFQARTEVARNIGLAVHLMDGPDPEAEAFIDTGMVAVAAVFDAWLADNLSREGEQINDGIRQNYHFCDGYHADWTGTPSN